MTAPALRCCFFHLCPRVAAVVRADDYDVFLTEYGDLGGVYIGNRGSTGFEVRSRGGGEHERHL
jgi:hypothetical protein